MGPFTFSSIVIATQNCTKNPHMPYFKASILLLLSTLIFLSCSEPSKKEVLKSIDENAEIQPVDFSSESIFDTNDIAGIYQGIFPCHDCDGMEQILFLKEDLTYKQAYVNVDSNKVFSTSNGEWEIQNNRIVLSKDSDYYISFVPREDSIYAVDIDGITVKDPKMYALGKKEFGGEVREWQTEIKNGITFAGRGMDPRWVLNIRNNIIYFKLHDRKNVLVADKEAIERDGHSTIYHLTTNKKPWTVTIKDSFCKNGMSDAMYEYEVIVDYDGIQYFGCGTDLKTN